MAVGGGSHDKAPIVVGRVGAGLGLQGQPLGSGRIGPIIAGPPSHCIRTRRCSAQTPLNL
jgi:hypothetical protein